jgi:hypothetical protein
MRLTGRTDESCHGLNSEGGTSSEEFLIAAVAVVASLALAGVAVAFSNFVTYSVQGTADGFGGYHLNTEPLQGGGR